MEQVRRKEQRKFQLMREREERMRKRESQAKLKKETLKWEREIKKEEKRQARVLDDLKWKGKKKFRDIKRVVLDRHNCTIPTQGAWTWHATWTPRGFCPINPRGFHAFSLPTQRMTSLG